MSRSTTHRMSEGEYDGGGLACYSVRTGITAATVSFGHFVVPFDGVIKQLGIAIETALTHATSDIIFGIISNTDSILEIRDIQNDTGYLDFLPLAEGVTVTKGDIMCWTYTGGDTTGALVTDVVIASQ